MVSKSLPPLICQMLQPSFYPHSTEESIRLIQTHTAYILLTGEYAYKVKKPVDYGFLNYATLAARKHYVEEELRLNQRTAKELYLTTVAIYCQAGIFSFIRNGAPVEYAVKMQQFPDGCLFSDLLEQQRLTPELMQALAHEVAKFHGHAAISDRTFGTVSQIRKAFDENYRQSRSYLGRGQTQQQLCETQAFSDHAFTHWKTRFQTRIQHHKIRECHGDLHLRNICHWQHRIVLFDCIEFNDALRHVDTMYDVAFTVMDCDAQGRSDLGNAFLNTYLEDTGDWEGLTVLPLYLSRQAYVRAKVTSFLLDDVTIADKHPQIQTQASAYYTLAWRYTQPQPGCLVLMSGLSGSGKSTLAQQIAQQVGAIYIRSDAVRKHLAGLSLHQRGDPSLYTPAMTEKTYDRLRELGVQLATLGYWVILDAKYDRIAARQAIIAQAKANHIPLSVLVCQAPLSVLHQRVQQRSGDITDATAQVLTNQRAEALTKEEASVAIYLDTTGELSDTVQTAVTKLRSLPFSLVKPP